MTTETMVEERNLNLLTTISSINITPTEHVENSSMYNDTVEEYNCCDEYDRWEEISRYIYLAVYPVIVIGGTVGNLLAFYVMRRGSMKKVSTCFYMSILALADTGLLWNGPFIDFVGHLTHWEVDLDIYTDCKPGYFLYYFCAQYSSSLLSIMSVEKFIALYFPLKSRSICTVKTAKWVSAITGFVLAIFNAQFFFVFDVSPHPTEGYGHCTFVRVSESYESSYTLIESSIYTFIPFTIMILANSAIIYKFIKAKHLASKEGTESTNQALNQSAVKGTAMLITVSVTFILLTWPVAFTYIITYSPHAIVEVAVTIPYYLNHAINAVLYCIVGSRFRNELRAALKCCKPKANESVGEIPSNFNNSRQFVSSISNGNVNASGKYSAESSTM